MITGAWSSVREIARRRSALFDALMYVSSNPKQNHLLAALPDPEWRRWSPQLEPITLPLGQVLYESGVTLSHVYFPTTAIISLLYVMQSGDSAEIAIVGNGGLVGIALFMGVESTPNRAVVQSAGHGFRVKADTIKRLQGNEIVMTQELIANMLGVRRERVTEGAGHLQDAGSIRYSRGLASVTKS